MLLNCDNFEFVFARLNFELSRAHSVQLFEIAMGIAEKEDFHSDYGLTLTERIKEVLSEPTFVSVRFLLYIPFL